MLLTVNFTKNEDEAMGENSIISNFGGDFASRTGIFGSAMTTGGFPPST